MSSTGTGVRLTEAYSSQEAQPSLGCQASGEERLQHVVGKSQRNNCLVGGVDDQHRDPQAEKPVGVGGGVRGDPGPPMTSESPNRPPDCPPPRPHGSCTPTQTPKHSNSGREGGRLPPPATHHNGCHI